MRRPGIVRIALPMAGLSVAVGAPALAQQADAEALRAGARVERVTITPNPIEITRGDSIPVRVTFADRSGAPVDSVSWDLIGGQEAIGTGSRPTPADLMLIARKPGAVTLYITVQVPGGTPDAEATRKSLDSIAVVVKEWPVARVEINDPEFAPYVGTTFKLTAKVVTSHDTEHEHAHSIWRTEDPCYVTVASEGVATFARAGKATILARAEGVTGRREIRITQNPVRRLEIIPTMAQARTGDVVHFRILPEDQKGELVQNVALSRSVVPLDSAGDASVDDDGNFVADRPGAYKVLVAAGKAAVAEAVVQVSGRPKGPPVRVVSREPVTGRQGTDLVVFVGVNGRDYSYLGTRTESGDARILTWDVTDPSRLVPADSLSLPTNVINQIAVSGEAAWALVSHAGRKGRGGLTVLDLSDPTHPRVAGELTDSLTAGAGRVWINETLAYVVDNGARILRVVDLGDRAHPRLVGSFDVRPGEPDKVLHDVWGDRKFLYLAYGDDGLIVLDVGEGSKNGSPTDPKLVTSIKAGNAHSVMRDGRYVYIAEEILGCDECVNGPRGQVRVIDVSKMNKPKDLARFEVPEAGAHQVLVENGVLHVAYRQGGLRLVDIAGDVRGDLYRQGRQVGWFDTASAGSRSGSSPTQVVGVRPFKGNIFISDANTGLWVLQHQRSLALER